MSDHDIAFWSLIAAAISIVFAILSIVFAILQTFIAARTRREANEAIAAQGAFEVPELRCSLGSKSGHIRDLILATRIEKGRVNELFIPIYIDNKGDKVAENVTIYIWIPKELTYGNAINVDTPIEIKKLLDVECNFIKEATFGMLAISIKRLQPYQNMQINIPISIRISTELSSVVHAVTSDGVSVSIDYSVPLYYNINVFAACERSMPLTFQYHLEVIDTSKKELVHVIDERSARLREQGKIYRRKQGLWKRVKERIEFARGMRPATRKVLIMEYLEDGKEIQKHFPIPVTKYKKVTLYEGIIDNSDGTYWSPSLGTSFFGSAPKIPLEKFTGSKT